MKTIVAIALLAMSFTQQSTTAPTSNVGGNIVNLLSDPQLAVAPYLIEAQSGPRVSVPVFAINGASTVIQLSDATVFIDPVGPQSQYARFGSPDIVVLTSVDPAHLSIDTMIGMLRRDTVVLAPQAVIDELPLMISNNTFSPFDPANAQEVRGIRFTALSATAYIPRDALVLTRQRGEIVVVMEADGMQMFF